MSLKLVELRTGRNEATDEIVASLERLLEEAKTGKFDGLVWGVSNIDGSYSTGYTKSLNFPGQLAAVTTLQHRMLVGRDRKDG